MAVPINSTRGAVTTTRRQIIAGASAAAAAAAFATQAAAAEPLEKLWADYQSKVAASEAAMDAYMRAEQAIGYERSREQDRAADEAVSATYRVLDLIDETPPRTIREGIIRLKSVHARACFNERLGFYEFDADGKKVAEVIRYLDALTRAAAGAVS